jgi:hypothetical protein
VVDVVDGEVDLVNVDDEVPPTVLSVTGSPVDVVVRSEVVGVVMLGPMVAVGVEGGRTRRYVTNAATKIPAKTAVDLRTRPCIRPAASRWRAPDRAAG